MAGEAFVSNLGTKSSRNELDKTDDSPPSALNRDFKISGLGNHGKPRTGGMHVIGSKISATLVVSITGS